MSLTEEKIIASITVLAIGIIEVREEFRILRDGEQIASSTNRYTLAPGDDLSAQPQSVAAIANMVWTPETVEAWQRHVAEQTAEMGEQAPPPLIDINLGINL